MSDTYGLEELGGRADGLPDGPVDGPVDGQPDVLAGTAGAGIRQRRGLRIARLALAAAILVVGAGAPAAFGSAALGRG
jgi:hypothetical protein